MSNESGNVEFARLLRKMDSLLIKMDEVIEMLSRFLKVSKGTGSVKIDQAEIDNEKLLKEWQRLRKEVVEGKSASDIARSFVNSHTKQFLRSFIRANSLSIDPKIPKDRIAEQLAQMLKVNKAVMKGLA